MFLSENSHWAYRENIKWWTSPFLAIRNRGIMNLPTLAPRFAEDMPQKAIVYSREILRRNNPWTENHESYTAARKTIGKAPHLIRQHSAWQGIVDN